jgi:hypothetical protein
MLVLESGSAFQNDVDPRDRDGGDPVPSRDPRAHHPDTLDCTDDQPQDAPEFDAAR